jgi:alginate O-acetyltransferase complex protein AlgI
MLFHSLQFMVFLPVVFALYWAVSDRVTLRKWLLLLASALFYMAWNPLPFLIVMYCATSAYLLARAMAKAGSPRAKKALISVSLVSNLGILGFFKYANFFYDAFAEISGWLGIEIVYHRLDILLPLGLSFVVFQTLSYTIDVYRGDCEARKDWVDIALYIAFFPEIVAGPILRAGGFLSQLDRKPEISNAQGAEGLLRVAKGLVKKMLIADLLAANIVDRVFGSPEVYTWLEVWTGVFAYTLQIYYDFSAYSDVAIGCAALFGFKIPENFDRPYKATNLPEFWKRWHISLSTWLRDYLYIPLGGNRSSKLLTLRNVMITMILGGIWHGASWRMGLWGAVHGVGMCLTRIFWWKVGMPTGKMPFWRVATAWFFTFMSVMLARIFFRAETMGSAYRIFEGLVPTDTWQAPNVTPRVLIVLCIATALHFGPSNLFQSISRFFVMLPIPVRAAALIGVVLVVKKVADFEVQPYIYFQF